MSFRISVSALLLGAIFGWPCTLPTIAQDGGEAKSDDSKSTDATPFAATPLTPLEFQEIQSLAQQLGSRHFAKRERAAGDLMQWGPSALAPLHHVKKNTTDPEIRDRVTGIIRQMTDGKLQVKIERFLAGDQVHFDGWERFREIMGDSMTLRKLFVDIHRSHPTLLAALEGTPRELSLAMETMGTKIQHQMSVQRRYPSQADTIALFLPVANENVPILAGHETMLISVLDKVEAQRIRKDAHLAPPFRRLIGNWVSRGTLSGRIDTLNKAMQWDVPEGLPLAIATLTEATEPETLATAMQTIVRFGNQEDAKHMKPLLSDSRIMSEAGYRAGQMIQSQVGDVAIAAIAILHGIPLADVGFPRSESHPRSGFTLLGIGYSDAQKELRNKNRDRANALISQPLISPAPVLPASESEGS